MSDTKNNGCSIGFGPSVLLTIVFLLLKVFDKVDWSYWIVFMPLWLPFAVVMVFGILLLLVRLILDIIDYKMKTAKKLLALLLAVVMVVSLFAACGKTEPAATTAAPEASADPAVAENAVFRKLYASEVTTLNYLITTQENEMTIAANVVDCLVEYDNLGNIEPALALEWSSNEDATVWTFKLREGVKWVDKDGKEVLVVREDCSRSGSLNSACCEHLSICLSSYLLCLVYLHLLDFITLSQFSEGCRIWTKSSDQIVDVLCLAVPIHVAELAGELRRWLKNL